MHCTNFSEFQLYSEALTFQKFLSFLLLLSCLGCSFLRPQPIAGVVDGGQILGDACGSGKSGREGANR